MFSNYVGNRCKDDLLKAWLSLVAELWMFVCVCVCGGGGALIINGGSYFIDFVCFVLDVENIA